MNSDVAKLLATALNEHPERCFLVEAVIHDAGGARVTLEIETLPRGNVISLVMSDGVPVRDYA